MVSRDRAQPSIQDVAKLAGVSLGTVSHVLNHPERVRESTLAKVNRAIDQIGFVRNDAARQLKAQRSSALGLVILDSANPFFGELARGVEASAAKHNFQILTGNSAGDQTRETNYLRMFLEQRLSGVLLSPVSNSQGLISELRSRGTQVVLVDNKPDATNCCSASVDDVSGGQMAVNHLISTGRTKIAFVGGPLTVPQIADRLTGARKAVETTSGTVKLMVWESIAQDVLSGREIGSAILKEPKGERPDAIFAANDLLAVGLLQAFKLQNQIAVPEDIAIIGYDDIDFAKSAVVPLSSIRQPAEQMGSTALELLIDEIDDPQNHQHRQVLFEPELVVRESTK